jgi:hypothetical protein
MPCGREKRNLGVVPGETFDAVCWSERDAAICLAFTWSTHDLRVPLRHISSRASIINPEGIRFLCPRALQWKRQLDLTHSRE